MKIPNSIRIGGTEYPIKYVDNLNNGTNLAYGHIDYENCRIELSATAGTAHEKQCKTMWHEILHGIWEHMGFAIENEEEIVTVFAKGIYQVLQDNERRFFDIVDGERRTEND